METQTPKLPSQAQGASLSDPETTLPPSVLLFHAPPGSLTSSLLMSEAVLSLEDGTRPHPAQM